MSCCVQFTANFLANLRDIEHFWQTQDAAQRYDALLDQLEQTLLPNLEQFPALGRPFLAQPVGAVEVAQALAKLPTLPQADTLREYLLTDYWVLYVQVDKQVYLLSIKHHRQLSFDFSAHWIA